MCYSSSQKFDIIYATKIEIKDFLKAFKPQFIPLKDSYTITVTITVTIIISRLFLY